MERCRVGVEATMQRTRVPAASALAGSRPRVHADAADLCRRSARAPRRRCGPARGGDGALRRRLRRAHVTRSVESLCADPAVDVVYVATPHQHHAAHVAAAARRRQARARREADGGHARRMRAAMIDAATHAGVHARRRAQPQLRPADRAHARNHRERCARRACSMIQAQYYTDFLYRPRRPEELDDRAGRRRRLQPGRAPGRHRAPAGRGRRT